MTGSIPWVVKVFVLCAIVGAVIGVVLGSLLSYFYLMVDGFIGHIIPGPCV